MEGQWKVPLHEGAVRGGKLPYREIPTGVSSPTQFSKRRASHLSPHTSVNFVRSFIPLDLICGIISLHISWDLLHA